jgi:membrane-associated protein
MGRMSYGYFISYNVFGGMVWVLVFTLLGYFFGNIPFVKQNFEFVILAIIFVSIVPAIWEAWKARREMRAESTKTEAETS